MDPKQPSAPGEPTPPATARAGGRRWRWASAAGLGAVALVVSLTPPGGAAHVAAQERAPQQQPQSDAVGYRSRPDLQPSPGMTTTTTGQEDAGLLLTTPAEDLSGSGSAAMYDNSGEPVWIAPGVYTNLQEITWQGRPALAAVTVGEVVVLDSTYTEIASFTMDGYSPDLHTLDFTEDASRLLLAAYVGVPYDLSAYGGPADATVTNAVIQEIDTATGEVTFEWSALDHVSPDETYQPLSAPQVDYLHCNSVAYDEDGDILLSGRHTSAIYKIDLETGEIVWRFGGRNSDFAFAEEAAMPSYQHDASMLPDGRLAAFDNGVGRDPQTSRGSVWEIDEDAMTAELVADLQPQDPLFAEFMGSNQPTANGNQIVSYGNTGKIVEFDGDGSRTAFTADFDAGVYSYKVTRTTDFAGTPATRPAVAWTKPAGDGGRTLHMSWNGATEVDRWRIEARPEAGGDFRPLATVERAGFETTARVTAPDDADVFRVTALDDDGRALRARVLTEQRHPTVPR